MFDRIEVLGEQLRHFLLNPPLAPGGRSSGNDFSTEVLPGSHDGTTTATTTTTTMNNNDPLILRYLPLLVLATLFWPVLVTLIAASISASAWLFWLCAGLLFGALQLLYVLYNFMMIFWDLGALTLLKTFAMLRSIVRYYFYKMSDAAGIEIKGLVMANDIKRSKKRRRKEWREEVDGATTYEEFGTIELFEPEHHHHAGSRSKKSGAPGRPTIIRRSSSLGVANANNGGSSSSSSSSSPSKSGRISTLGLRFRKLRKVPSVKTLHNNASQSSNNNGSSSPMKKNFSSNDLTSKAPKSSGGNSTTNQRRGSAFRSSTFNGTESTTTTTPSSNIFPLRRISSSALPLSESNDEQDDDTANDDNYNYLDGNQSCPKWQQFVKEDLGGMTGSMLLTTLSRLKEARMQASTMNNNISNSSSGSVSPSKSSSATNLGVLSIDEHDNEEEETDGDDDDDDDDDELIQKMDDPTSSFHITASFTTPSSPTRRARNEDYSSSLKTLLSGIVKRNHLGVDDFLMEDARSVAERGQHSLKKETRETIDRYGEEVERCMDWVSNGPVYLGNNRQEIKNNTPEQIMQKQRDELSKRYTLLKRMKQNMGHTALMLSGGGAQAMYHLGTIKALVESELYQHIHVISGTSGGSISAAMCAIKTPAELLTDICVDTVSSDYMLDGQMKQKGISWFPSMYKMGAYWMKSGLPMDSKEFLRCCNFYYKDITFEEAFEMTGKHVCITVSASRASAGSGVQRLLLNHISTPNVTLASSVAASCAVPGIMAPAKLMIKDSRGKQVPFEVDGVEWIDGSVQADLPFKRISTLFNISNFVVAQTNFHVVPFLNKAHHPNINTLYWKMFQMCMWDVKSRVMNLSQLGLFPKFFGQDLSKMFKQKYYGKLTLVPRFTTMQLFGLKVLSNPTVADMKVYLQNGQLAAWPFLRVLKEMLRIERCVDRGLTKLDERLKSVSSGFDYHNDDNDSLSYSSAVGATYRAHLPGLGREAELLKEKVRDLEQENKQLREQVTRLQRSLGISHSHGHGALEGRLVSVSGVGEEDDEAEEKKTA